jgi:hypothetical protein
MASLAARKWDLLTVSQTVSQNREFDLSADSAKVLIKLKVRIQVVPVKGIELRHKAPKVCDTYPELHQELR